MLFSFTLNIVATGRFRGRPAPNLAPPQGFLGPENSAASLAFSQSGLAAIF
jgi:hypothetical protein